MQYAIFKRLIDIILAIIILVLVSPIMILAYILLKISNKSAFFVQKRPGKNAVIFKIIKFKTMNDKLDKLGNLLPDKVRLTPIGKMVRNLSIDELPQLINVLKGEMSLIGPRPLLPEYLSYYSDAQIRRHEVRPGITGWAQVNGRNAISWNEKFEFDVWYVNHLSFSLDCKILYLTVLRVFKGDGINQPGQATMEKFTGNN